MLNERDCASHLGKAAKTFMHPSPTRTAHASISGDHPRTRCTMCAVSTYA